MSQRFDLLSIKFRDEQFGEGTIEINENTSQAELQHKRKWYSDSWETVTKFAFTPKTSIEVHGTAVSVQDLYFTAKDEQDAAMIARLIAKPGFEERKRTRLQILKQFEEQVRRFLALRLEGLSVAENLRKAPRQTVVESSHLLSEDAVDPFDELLEVYSRRLRDAQSGIDLVSKRVTDELRGQWTEDIYAIVYGISSIQDAIYSNDRPNLEKGLNFMSDLCGKRVDGLEGLSAADLTSKLLEEGFTYISRLVQST